MLTITAARDLVAPVRRAAIPLDGSGGDYDWSAFDSIKATRFSPDREPAFHYAIAANQYAAASNTSSGISRGIGASDLLVTLGAFQTPGGTVPQQAGTLMHELGHNIGLCHGGPIDSNSPDPCAAADANRKPNHISSMNHAFQLQGISRAASVGATSPLDPNAPTRVDYSHGVELPAPAKHMQKYADRLFARPSFKHSLTEIEREMRR